MEIEKSTIPETVKVSEFGCVNCLWAGIECRNGSKYAPKNGDKNSCGGYTYFD